jgi:hypothetical protein
MDPTSIRVGESEPTCGLEVVLSLLAGRPGREDGRQSWMGDSDAPSSRFDVSPACRLGVQAVECFGGVATLIEPGAVHRFDLALAHPDSVGVVADRRPEQLASVDEMQTVDAGGHDHGDGSGPRRAVDGPPSRRQGD